MTHFCNAPTLDGPPCQNVVVGYNLTEHCRLHLYSRTTVLVAAASDGGRHEIPSVIQDALSQEVALGVDIEEAERLDHPCDICHGVMTPDEWADRHWAHEEDCPRHRDTESTVSCTCDLEVHARCCTDCI